MDEIDRPLRGLGTVTEPNGSARNETSAAHPRKEEGTQGTAADDRPLFTTTDDIDPEVNASDGPQHDLQPRGVGVSGVLGDAAGPAAAVVPDLGVATSSGETAATETAGQNRAERAPEE